MRVLPPRFQESRGGASPLSSIAVAAHTLTQPSPLKGKGFAFAALGRTSDWT